MLGMFMMESSRPRYFVILSISILQFLSVITPNEQVGNLNDINEGKRPAFLGNATLYESLHESCSIINNPSNACLAIPNGFNISYSQEGDIVLGGLLPVHMGIACSTLEDMGTIQRLEAVAFAVNDVNGNPSYLKNLTLGFRIYDTCNSETITLARCLELLPSCIECGNNYPICAPYCPFEVVGFVGPESSSNTLVAAHACNIALTPVVSYFATSVELTNQLKYPTLFRTVPSDDYQVTAMLDLLNYFGWNYFSIVHSDDRYGKDASEYMQSNMVDMCLATSEQVSRTGSDESYLKVMSDLLAVKEYSKSSVVIVFTDGQSANKLFKAVEQTNTTGQFIWIGSEGWGVSTNDIAAHLDEAQGALTFVPHTEYNDDFDAYFQSLGPDHDENPWWREVWSKYFNNCLWDVPESDESSCLQYQHIDIDNGYIPDSTVSLVTDAIYSYAQAIQGYLNDTFPGKDTISPDELDILPWELLRYLRKILEFPTANTEDKLNIGTEALYDINNLQFIEPDRYEYVLVGKWSSKTGLYINEDLIQWPNGETAVPKSYCTDPCAIGEAQVLIKTSCCWDCEPCTSGAIVVNNTRCQLCPSYYWPDVNRTQCEIIPAIYLHWYDAPAIILAVLASVNIVLTKLSTMFFIRHRDDPLIKASGKELMGVILFGIFAQNILVFILLAEPSSTTCLISRFVFGLDFTITYAPLLVKSNRIFRIFKGGKKSPVPPKWIQPRDQLVIAGIIIFIQVAITTTLVFIVPPKVINYLVSPSIVEKTCTLEQITVLVPLGYNFVLVFACLVHSWKTRQLPTNFRESRFITFIVFTTLILWTAFIPIYLTTSNMSGTSTIFRVEILASVEILSSFITLASLFFPKYYAIAFVPRSAWHLDKEFLKTTNRIRYYSERNKSTRMKTVTTDLDDIEKKSGSEDVKNIKRTSPDGISLSSISRRSIKTSSSTRVTVIRASELHNINSNDDATERHNRQCICSCNTCGSGIQRGSSSKVSRSVPMLSSPHSRRYSLATHDRKINERDYSRFAGCASLVENENEMSNPNHIPSPCPSAVTTTKISKPFTDKKIIGVDKSTFFYVGDEPESGALSSET